MSLDATIHAWKLKGISPTQKLVLLSLADRAGEDHTCWPSMKRISDDCCLSKSSVKRAINQLCEIGILRRENRVQGKANLSSVYQIIGVQDRHDNSSGGGVTVNLGWGHSEPRGGVTVNPKLISKNLSIESMSSKPEDFDQHGGKMNGAQAELFSASEPSEPQGTEEPEDWQTAYDEFTELAKQLKLPVPRKLTDTRKASLKRRLKEDGLDGWRQVLTKIRQSDFLSGRKKSEKSDWELNVDWLLKPANFNKILEGNYDNKKPVRTPQLENEPKNNGVSDEFLVKICCDYLSTGYWGRDEIYGPAPDKAGTKIPASIWSDAKRLTHG